MKPICVLTLGAVVVGCHLDKLVGGSGGGSPPPSHGTPVGLAFTAQPRTAQAGQPITPVKVSIVDSAGHPVAGVDTTAVAVALGDNPGSATLHGDTSTHPVNGIATFTNLWLDNAGNNYTLAASAGRLSVKSAPFDIMPPPPTTGTLNVTTNTTANPPASGYTVSVSGAPSQSIAASATVTFLGLSAGTHTVTLNDVPSNCTVSAGTSQSVTITAGQPTSATFTITCTPPPPTTGSLTVTTTTSGPSQPSAYTVTVDAGSSQAVGATGSVTFNNLGVGTHSVGLSPIPSNCNVSGANPQTVSITANNTTTASFTINCTATTGDLAVTTVTTGSSLPSGGYTATLDGGASQSIGLSGNVTFPGISAGAHTIALSGVPSNCSVSPGASQTVTVPAGGTVSAPFAISCITPPPPQNHPPAVTAGGDQTVLIGALFNLSGASFSDQDHDGPWTVTIDWGDGGSDTFAMTTEGAISGSHSYHDLVLATHKLTITVVDAHSASGTASKTVNVVASLP